MNSIKVSIVVVSYNQEKFIKQTLDSIVNQKHSYTWELIVCDDASKDSTPDIIKEFSKKEKNIIPILRKENLGVVNNFFDGVSKCKGEYIMVCGGDDYFLPGKIENQIEFFDKHPNIGLIHGDLKVIDEKGSLLYYSRGEKKVNYQELLIKNQIKTPTIAIRKSELNRYINDVNPTKRGWMIEDRPLAIWFAIESKIEYLPGLCTAYRIVKGSLTHPISSKKLISYINSSFDVNKYYEAKYPNLIKHPCIVNIYIDNFLKNLHGSDCIYKEYCQKILTEYRKEGIRNYRLKKMRINYPIINLGWKFYDKWRYFLDSGKRR